MAAHGEFCFERRGDAVDDGKIPGVTALAADPAADPGWQGIAVATGSTTGGRGLDDTVYVGAPKFIGIGVAVPAGVRHPLTIELTTVDTGEMGRVGAGTDC